MTQGRNIRRVLVALDVSAPSQAALEAAASIAGHFDAELLGVFVQDQDLLRLARLPMAREVGLTSARHRDLAPDDMERAWRGQAARAKAALEAVASRYRVPSSFRVERGNVVAELVRAATESVVLAMGTMGHMHITGSTMGSTVRGVTTTATCSVLLLRHDARVGGAVYVVCGNSPVSDHALSWARHLATVTNSRLIVLMRADDEEETQTLRTHIEEALEDFEGNLTIAESTADDLPRVLKDAEDGLLIVPHDSEVFEEADQLLGNVRLPVLVAR